MDDALQAQVERARMLADELGTEIRGAHLLDALGELSLRLDAGAALAGVWSADGIPAASQTVAAARIAELLPEIDPADLLDRLQVLDLELVHVVAEANVAAAAWLQLVDEARAERRSDA